MVFFVYIVYELLLLSLAESAEDVNGFLRLHRLCAPVYFSRSDTQWLLSLAESAEDFYGFLYLHRLRAPVCLSRYDTQWLLCRRFPWFSSSHRLRVPVRLSRSPMLRTSALPDLQFLAFGNSQFDSLIFTFDLALLDFSMSIRSTSRIDLVVLVPDLIWFDFSVVRNVRFSFQ